MIALTCAKSIRGCKYTIFNNEGGPSNSCFKHPPTIRDRTDISQFPYSVPKLNASQTPTITLLLCDFGSMNREKPLQNQLKELILNDIPKANSLGKAGKEFVSSNFSWKIIAKNFVKIANEYAN